MITVDMPEAQSRLGELVKAVEEKNETVVLCRDGLPIAELKSVPKKRYNRRKVYPELKVTFAPGFDPTEPATEEDWPQSAR